MSSILESLMAGRAGVALSSQGTPLQRLHYFDGKFLRAEHMREEQDYIRALVSFANQASGVGIVHGFEMERAEGDLVRVYPGLATDPGGRTLLLQGVEEVSMAELIAASIGARRTETSTWSDSRDRGFGECDEMATFDEDDIGDGLWLISAHPADRLCGSEDVYGLLCEQACYTDTQHPYIREGVLLQARPLDLGGPLPSSSSVSLDEERFWRSRVASAWFAMERSDPSSLISAAGLRSGAWCRGASAREGNGVALAVVGRRGSTTRFLDLWTVRRERMEASPRRYWAARMAMRPWDVFLAQILQFQCHLTGLAADAGSPPPGDDCEDALASAAGIVGELRHRLESAGDADAQLMPLMIEQVTQLGARLRGFLGRPARSRRLLLDHGIVELPSAGYLPVAPGDTGVEEQVRSLMGEGVDLRFCAVRPDFVAHALEEAQHMDRISLVQGLDDPEARPRVDILVPDGEVSDVAGPSTARGYDMTLAVEPRQLATLFRENRAGRAVPGAATAEEAASEGVEYLAPDTFAGLGRLPFAFRGAARVEATPGGGAAIHYAGLGVPDPAIGRALLGGCLGGINESPTGRWHHLAEATLADGEAALERWVEAQGLSVRDTGEEDPGAESAAPSTEGDDAERIMAALRTAAREGRINFGVNTNVETVISSMVMAPQEPVATALWTSMTSDLDPFAMAEGEITRVALEVEAVIARQGRAVPGRMTVQGHLTVEEAAAGSGTAIEVRGVVDGIADAGGGEDISGTVTLRKAPARDGGPTIEFSLQVAQGVRFELTRRWSGGDQARVCVVRSAFKPSATHGDSSEPTTPPMATMYRAVEYVENTSSTPVAAADQTLAPGALAPGSAAYADAVGALDLFRLANPSLAAVRQRKLFADVGRDDGGRRIRARHGWVLFHRRREKRCGGRAPEVLVRRERLRALYVEVTEKDRRPVLAALASLDEAGLGRLPWRGLGTVEYRAGERGLHDAGAGIRGAWQSAGLNGRTLRGAAIAATDWDAVGGQGIGAGRLDKALGALGSVAGVGDVQRTVLASVPGAISAAGTDGVVLLVADTADAPRSLGVQAIVVDPLNRLASGVTVVLTGCGPQSSPGAGEAAHCTSPRSIGEKVTDSTGRVSWLDLEADQFYQLSVTSTVDGLQAEPKVHVFRAEAGMQTDYVFTLLPIG